MKICFVPIDNRPVCYNLAKDIAAIDEEIELLIPPREFLGDLTKNADVDEVFAWLKKLPEYDAMILSLDTLAYGGLIPSRRSKDSFEEIKSRIMRLKPLLKNKKVYAFSSIMRISNNNYNEEEKEYWSEYGTKIFEYSFNYGGLPYDEPPPLPSPLERKRLIPQVILDDYLATRKRNFEINKLYLEWQKEGLFETLIFSKDDCAPRGFNVEEAKELELLGGKTKTGADEIPLTLLARAIEKDIYIYPKFLEPDYKRCISNYEDVSIEESVLGQIELGGFKLAETETDADVVLVVNNFIETQGELVMGWETPQKSQNTLIPPTKPYAVADVRFANGGDNDFVENLLKQINLDNFYGYAGWNTSANTLGSLLAGVKVKFNASKYNDSAFRSLQMTRFLDDWAYQANVRGMINETCDINNLMQPFEKRLEEVFSYKPVALNQIQYIYPWDRKFEIEVCL